MTPPPGWAAELHYADDELVELDLDAIIARGSRLRRRRRFIRLAAIAAVCGTVPAAIFLGRLDPKPALRTALGTEAPANAPAHGVFSGAAGAESGPEKSETSPEKGARAVPSPTSGGGNYRVAAGINNLELTPSEARLHVKAHVPARFGRLLAIAGARARSGVWLAAAASRLTLIHVSANGALESWQLPAGSSQVRANTDVGLAVSAGVAWLGLRSTLIRVDTKARPAQVSSWRLPGPQASHANTAMAHALFAYGADGKPATARLSAPTGRLAPPTGYALAVGPGGRVAVARLHSSSVQLFDPYVGTFRQIRLPAQADQSLAVGFARNGTLGIGYLGESSTSAVLLVKRSGAELTATVAQSSAVSAYGRSALLVGTSRLDVVSWRGQVRPLVLPAGRLGSDRGSAPPAPLPGGRFGIVSNAGILTFPGAAGSVTHATEGSLFWSIPLAGCSTSRCRSGYRLLATDAAGNIWLVPSADPGIVELLSVR